jgi:hypothetical protein
VSDTGRVHGNKGVYMKKVVAVFISLIAAVSAFSQTWTVRMADDDVGDVDCKYTIITKQQYERILNSHKINNDYVIIRYLDNLELTSNPQESVISGTSPILRGDFYIYAEFFPKTNIGKDFFTGARTMIIYGNSETGHIKLWFCYNQSMFLSYNFPGTYPLNSNSFKQQYDRLVRTVEGK